MYCSGQDPVCSSLLVAFRRRFSLLSLYHALHSAPPLISNNEITTHKNRNESFEQRETTREHDERFEIAGAPQEEGVTDATKQSSPFA
jgi:hypothetical protein